MRNVKRPNFYFKDVVAEIDKNTFTDDDIYFLTIEEFNYERYIGKMMHLIPKNNRTSYTTNELIDIYDEKFRKTKYYSNIVDMVSGFCPFCGITRTDEIDHFLPKKKYPSLSIIPNNLIPICTKCNKKKKKSGPQTSTEYYFHPYFHKTEKFLSFDCYIRKDVMCFKIKKFAFKSIYSPLFNFTYDELKLRTRIIKEAAQKFNDKVEILRDRAMEGKQSLLNHLHGNYSFTKINDIENELYLCLYQNLDLLISFLKKKYPSYFN